MKKYFNYRAFLFLFIFFLLIMTSGAIVKYHYEGGKNYKLLQKIVIFISSVPKNTQLIFFPAPEEKQLIRPKLVHEKYQKRFRHYNEKFNFKNKQDLDILLVLNYTNPSNNKHEINIIDLKTYKSIFEFKFDYDLFTDIKSESNKKFKEEGNHTFLLYSAFLTEDIEFIALTNAGIISKFSPITKEIIWFNDSYKFHHTFFVNEDKKHIWAIGCSKDSKIDKIYISKDFCDDFVIKIDLNTGKILEEISITQLMIDEGIHNHLFIGRKDISANDPLHINDVEEVMIDSNFFDKSDLFVSLGHTNMILLIDPNKKKIKWKLHDKLFHQHDVDIINSEEIAIFNNNRIFTYKDQVYKNNEINIFNFSTNEFSSPYDTILKKNDVRTVNQGLFEITEDGVFVEEQNSGRYIFFKENGDIIFEYINKSEKKGDVYQMHWSRLITDKNKIKKVKNGFINEKN